MAEFKDMLKYYRSLHDMSQAALAKELGLSASTISMYEVGQREPDFETEEKIADYFNVDLNTLRGKDIEDDGLDKYGIQKVKFRNIPILGEIACGEPIITNQTAEYLTVEDAPDAADLVLIAKGDSMINARIMDGDYVFIHQQPDVDNGDIAAVIIRDEATLKRVYYDKKHQTMTLNAENPAYAPMVYMGEELSQIRIIGKAIAFQSAIR